MAFFQTEFSRLYPHKARLFANGKSGAEKFILHAGGSATLEVSGLSDKSVRN